ncbi:pseudouridine synthase [Pelagophyceae sp. CCMP2097]|nr:pseudouridine synthase [Pelagophyceae sp. CCMP2097]|mmetsp:Transcript_22800/g.78069  ORF Transcript_22800/g.78069 Transcript_22800/m.78069 type:complete len:406 (+) Transcript_22800:42-1259(+)
MEGGSTVAGVAADRSVRVLHVDDTIVVIDKPSGLLSVPGLEPGSAPRTTKRKRGAEYWLDALTEFAKSADVFLAELLDIKDLRSIPRRLDKFERFVERNSRRLTAPADATAVAQAWHLLDGHASALEADDEAAAPEGPSALTVVRALFSASQAPGETIHAVHRLDYETSGVLVFARTRHAASDLGAAFRRDALHLRKDAPVTAPAGSKHNALAASSSVDPPGDDGAQAASSEPIPSIAESAHEAEPRATEGLFVAKIYEAVVRGAVAGPAGEWSWAIAKDDDARALDGKPRYRCVDDGAAGGGVDDEAGGDVAAAKRALTKYEVISVDSSESAITTRLRLTPATGRSHQLRVHCLKAGTPIVGDPLYGPPHAEGSTQRLLLHAASLTLRHPKTADLRTYLAQTPF